MTYKELEKKAEESYWNSDVSGSFSSKKCYILGFIACAKELQEENNRLAMRVYELQSDLSREKFLHEQLKEHCDELELINQKVMEDNERLETDLEYAKTIIKDLLNNSHEYSRQNAEDFIKGEKK